MLTLTSPVKKIRRFGVFPRVDVSFVCFASVSSHLRVQRAVPILAAKGELPRGDFLGEILTWPHPAAPEEAEHLACFGGNQSFDVVAARRFASPALRHSATLPPVVSNMRFANSLLGSVIDARFSEVDYLRRFRRFLPKKLRNNPGIFGISAISTVSDRAVETRGRFFYEDSGDSCQ